MIELLSGAGVGAGKSYYVASRIINILRNGGTVYYVDTFWPIFHPQTLLHGKREYKSGIRLLVEERFGVEVEADQLVSVSEDDVFRLHEVTPPGTDDNPVLIILDEAQGKLNARDWADAKKRPFFDWCCQSRHDSNDLLIISQHEANTDKQLRRLCTRTIRVKNMAEWGFEGWRNPPYLRNFFWATVYHSDSTRVLWVERLRKDAGVYGCYVSKSMRDTHTRLRTRGAIPRRQLRKIRRRSPMIKFVFAAFVVFSCWFLYGLCADYYHGAGWFAKGPGTAFNLPAKATSVHSEASRAAAVPAPSVPLESVSVHRKEFLGGDGRTFLVTNDDEFYLGEMSDYGVVRSIHYRTAVCAGLDGRPVYIVATDRRSPDGGTATEQSVPEASTASVAYRPGRAPIAERAGLPVPVDPVAASPSPSPAGRPGSPWLPISKWPRQKK